MDFAVRPKGFSLRTTMLKSIDSLVKFG